jgi:simple sugar transport system ATP-binding protein
LILDEPTTSLTRREVEALFTVIKDLKSKGIATLFISHKLDEVLQVAERVTILRDGKKIGTYMNDELTIDKLTFLMTGEKLEYTGYRYIRKNRKPFLEVRNLSKKGNFRNISFTLYSGEVLGITGLLGSGRTELAQALFGMNKPDSGDILIENRKITIRSVRHAIRQGIGYVPENRLVQGLVLEQSVGKNMISTIVEKLLNRLGLIDRQKRKEKIDKWVKDLSIRIPSVDAAVQTLSGGNQQKVVVAKWIATDPKILILDGPTVGIDVAAKSSIHEIIRDLAEKGIGIIIISDEVSEVMHSCNRILVMHKGEIIEEYETVHTTEEEVQNSINMSA